MTRSGIVPTLVAISLVVGCGGARTVKTNFSGDFNCQGPISVSEISQGRYRASGCGTDAVYQCVSTYGGGTLCSLQLTDNRDDSVATLSGQASGASQPVEARGAEVAQLKDGRSAVRLELKLDDDTLLKLVAKPGNSKISMRLLVRKTPEPRLRLDQPRKTQEKECQIGWLVNGERKEGPKSKVTTKQNFASYSASLDPEFIRELGAVRKLSLRVCKRKWSLRRGQVGEIRRFIDLYEEESAWGDAPSKRDTGGRVAPSGGWPEWGSPDPEDMAAAATGKPLDAQTLFRQLKRSVYQVEALGPDETTQGSAVAVTKSELLTNCHVVEGAKKLILKQEKREWVAKLSRSDPKTDRCVLSIPDPILEPVVGVRTWDGLEIGEPLYALGSPAGFELTLSNGILSGRREEKDARYVQTTAPISPGSSGGGLFDARGNLVGITTLVFAGSERLNQALNFAIPADSFFAP